MSHRKTLAVVAACIIIGLLAFLAVSLLTKGGGVEPGIGYSTMARDTAKTEERIKAFIEVAPDGAHHIGDVIDVRIIVVFKLQAWEVLDDVGRDFVPLTRQFEVKSRSVKNFSKDGMAFVEVKWLVQCLECREGRYAIEVAGIGFTGIRAENKADGKVSGLRLPTRYITFVPFPDNQYLARSLPYLPEEKNQKHVFYFVLAGVSLAVLAGLTIYGRIKKSKEKIRGSEIAEDRFVKRIKELEEELESADPADTGHCLNSLLLSFERERGRSKELEDLTGELSDLVYSGEEVSPGNLKSLIRQAKAYIEKWEA